MLNIDMRKIYNFYPVEPAPAADALPKAGDLYYECLDCTGIISSVPRIQSACTCGNLSGNGGETVIKDPSRVRVVRGKLK
ncbi:MAG: hypothetical protein N3C59_04895 [Azovibrio sp.]|nr:hypothetical protein [Azovibrio sp.]